MARLNIVLAALLVLCALALVTSQHRARKLYAQREHEKARMLELRSQWARLEGAQNRLATAEGIAQQARQKLRMQVVPAERTLHLSLPASDGGALSRSGLADDVAEARRAVGEAVLASRSTR